jgi:hypothetical protein
MIKLKNYILDIVVFVGLMFFPTGNAFGAKSINAGQSQTQPADNFDFFPEYHQEAQENTEIQQAVSIREEKKNEKDETDGAFVASAKWFGKMIPYEFLYADYAGYINRVNR